MRPSGLPLSSDAAHAVLAAAVREIVVGAAAAFRFDLYIDPDPTLSAFGLDRALGSLAWWAGQYRDATRVGDLLQLRAGALEPIPHDLQQAWEQAARDWLTDIARPPLADTTTLVSELLSNFDLPRRTILTRRVLTATPATLAVLSDELGVSEERVRALESNAIARLRFAMVRAARWAPLRWRAAELRHQMHGYPPTQWSDILHDFTTDVPDSMRDFTGQLLLWLADHHKIPSGLIGSDQAV
jgi:hypothetical protein